MSSNAFRDPTLLAPRITSKGSVGTEDPSVQDPVCGMKVTPPSPHTLTHHGTRIYFCGPTCKATFLANPAKYQFAPGAACVTSKEAAKPVAPGATYTCPMHPQIRQIGPGACPICGMALEPVDPTLDTSTSPELVNMRRRFWIGVPLALVVLVLAMGHDITGLAAIANASWSPWVQFALSTPVVLWCGWPFLVRGVESIGRLKLNMFTLIALGVAAAYVYSVTAILAPQLFPADLRDMHGRIGIYFEASAVIVVLVLLGQVLELQARERTGGAIRALLKLAPKSAHRVTDEGNEMDIPLQDSRVGDRLRVRPGERIPVDGVVESGASSIDE